MRAWLAALLADGLGYLYVGRPVWAFGLWAARTAVIFLLAGSRAVISSGGFYWLVATGIALIVVVPLHAAWYARQHPVQRRTLWTHAGIYVAYFVVAWMSNAVLSKHRAQWQGFESYQTPSLSMSPTLEPGDYLIADTWRYRGRGPQVGDIVAFRLPSDDAIYLKRVVAVPGDHVEIRGGLAVRNGTPLQEPYVHAPLDEAYSRRDFAYAPALGIAEYYVLGDLRDNSKDSRNWGPIQRDWIIGRVEYRWLALDGWKLKPKRFPHSLVNDSSSR